ncbi:MAG: cytochrome c [Ectothiorhodospiraceae bacterium]|jgi:cytochrome c553
MNRGLILTLAAMFALASAGVMAQPVGGDAAAGKAKSQACAACHGADGNSTNPTFPKLAGQYADYILHALKAYKSGARQNPIMSGQVANLSEQDMKDLATYFSSQQSNLTTLPR